MRAWLDTLLGGPAEMLPRFAAVLPYQHHDPDSQLYGMPAGGRNGCVGFVLEGLPQVGSSEAMEETLQGLPALLEPGVCLQVSMYADPDVRELLAGYCLARPGPRHERATGVHRRMARRRYEHLQAQVDELAPRNYRLLVSATVPGGTDDSRACAQADGLRESLAALLADCSVPTRRLAPQGLIQLVGGIVNPANPRRLEPRYDRDRLIAEQCLLGDTEVEIGPHSVAVAGDGQPHELVAMVATSYPPSMRLAWMQGLLGDSLRLNLRYLGPFMITVCMQGVDQEQARTLISLKAARAATNAKSPMAHLMPGYYRRQLEDWRMCAEATEAGGGMILMSHQLLVRAAPAQIQAAVESARSVWRARGFTLSRCEYLQLQGLLAALPLALTPSLARDMRKVGWLGRKTTYNAAHGMPVVAEWKGTANPALLFIGRRGQLMPLDIFDAEGNYNVVVAGASGSGKSVLLNEIAVNKLGLGAKVWILDIGRSYERSCEYLGGQFLRFSPGAKVSLNPFSAVADINEDLRLLKPLFAQMIAPLGGLSDYQRSRLEEAIMLAWERHGVDATPTAVRAELYDLRGADPRVRDMAAQLGPFAAGGMHGDWFAGPATIDFAADLVVLELEELKGNPELQLVVMMQLLFLISQQMYASVERQKLVVIDEVWDLMRGDHVAEFIEHGYRRSRKYNGAFLSASQSVADFYALPAGRAAVANSDWMMLLAQKNEEIASLVEAGQLALGAAEQELLRSLHTRPGSYSEVLIRGAGGASAVGRLAVDRFAQLLYSTRAEDRQAVDRQRRGGLDLPASIAAVLAERAHAAHAAHVA